MYVTHMPGRVVFCETLTVPSKNNVFAGRDGLFSRVKFSSGKIVVADNDVADITKGYTADEGETLDFSGKISLYNPTENEITVSVICFDTI